MPANTPKPSFVKLFASGFAIGAVALVGFQSVNAEASPIVPTTQAPIR